MELTSYFVKYDKGELISMSTKQAVKLITNNIMTKSTLGRTLGVSPQSIYNYEEQKSSASLTVADKFRELFLIEINDIGKLDRGLTKYEIKQKVLDAISHIHA